MTTELNTTQTRQTRRRRPRRRSPKKAEAGSAPRACPFFLRGFCREGSACPLLHEPVAATSSPPASSPGAASSSTHDCPICFEQFPSQKMRSISTCKEHRYCLGCLRNHFHTLVSSNELHRMACPHPECEAVPTERDLRTLLTKKQHQMYERFSVLSACKGEKALWCPFPNCGALCLADDHCTDRAACPTCQGIFCLLCSRPDHLGIDCTSNLVDVQFAEWTQKQGKKVKLCPACLEQVAKSDGCNHMTCICGHGFCWLCARETDGSHFSMGHCGGLQFSNHDSVRDARMAESLNAYNGRVSELRYRVESEQRSKHQDQQRQRWRQITDELRKSNSVRVWNQERRRYYWQIENKEAYEAIKKEASKGLREEFNRMWEALREERELLIAAEKEALEVARAQELVELSLQLDAFDRQQADFDLVRSERIAAIKQQRAAAEKARREAEEHARREAEERARREAEARAAAEQRQARSEASLRTKATRRSQRSNGRRRSQPKPAKLVAAS